MVCTMGGESERIENEGWGFSDGGTNGIDFGEDSSNISGEFSKQDIASNRLARGHPCLLRLLDVHSKD